MAQTRALEKLGEPTMAVLKSTNPSTGATVGTVEVTDVAEIPRIVAQAKNAQSTWGALSSQERADLLRPAGAMLTAESNRIGELATQEMGKPLPEAVGEVRACGDGFSDELDEMVEALSPQIHENKRVRSTIYRTPLV